jgi:hypothetical protein
MHQVAFKRLERRLDLAGKNIGDGKSGQAQI